MSRQGLAAALRRARTEAQLSEEAAAARLECPRDQFRRIETGRASIRLAEVRTLLDLYGAAGDQRDRILSEARKARDRSWWYPYADLVDATFETQLILEDDAASMSTYQPNLVPGLLQTERYAWELIGTRSDIALEAVRRQASLRMMRQRVLSRDSPPRLAIVLDEAVLRRPVGGPAVMREQYERLAQVAAAPGFTIQVLPFKAGPHRAMGAGFHIYAFPDAQPPVVQLELLDRVHFVADDTESAHYAAAFDHAAQCAYDPDRSLALLRELARGD